LTPPGRLEKRTHAPQHKGQFLLVDNNPGGAFNTALKDLETFVPNFRLQQNSDNRIAVWSASAHISIVRAT
jgi:hypothetical protein